MRPTRAHGRRVLCATLILTVSILVTPIRAGAAPPAGAQSASPAGCVSEGPETIPAAVDMTHVLRDLYALEDASGTKLLPVRSPDLDAQMARLFDPSFPRSKLEQFYTMLFHVAHSARGVEEEIALRVGSVRALLLSTKVFSTPELPHRITAIHLLRRDPSRPRYQVLFDSPEVRLPLNRGMGFGVHREGMCQHAKELVFYGGFSFTLAMRKSGLEVQDFDRVDLWGTFGSRGVVDVDINYVSVKSVQFMTGSVMGLVKAKVSRREFQVNRHSFLLELVSRFVTDKSVQPIDW
jgi:hypothetical protein